MALLDDAAVARGLASLAGWSRDGRTVRKEYEFGTFADVIGFVNRVADLAEAADHHPDIDIRYRRVTLVLSTHSAGGITEKDIALARQIDGAG